MKKLLFVVCLFVANIAFADRLVNINLVVVEHPTSPPVADQIRLFQEGISRLSEVGIKARIIKIDIVPDLYNVNTYNDLLSRLFVWSEYGKKQRFKGIVFYALPPIAYGNTFLGAGHAGAICVLTRNFKKKYAEGTMRLFNASGADRQAHSRVIALHEVLHLLGTNHIDTKTVLISKNPFKRDFVDVVNVMHENAQAYATEPNLPILAKTKRQVRYCKQGKNVLGK